MPKDSHQEERRFMSLMKKRRAYCTGTFKLLPLDLPNRGRLSYGRVFILPPGPWAGGRCVFLLLCADHSSQVHTYAAAPFAHTLLSLSESRSILSHAHHTTLSLHPCPPHRPPPLQRPQITCASLPIVPHTWADTTHILAPVSPRVKSSWCVCAPSSLLNHRAPTYLPHIVCCRKRALRREQYGGGEQQHCR